MTAFDCEQHITAINVARNIWNDISEWFTGAARIFGYIGWSMIGVITILGGLLAYNKRSRIVGCAAPFGRKKAWVRAGDVNNENVAELGDIKKSHDVENKQRKDDRANAVEI